MVKSIIKKSNTKLKFLYRKSEFLTAYTKRLLVNSLIQCHFDYASSAWYYGLSQDLKHKLQITQNKIIRFVLNLLPRSHIGRDQFNNLKWLPVHSRVNQILLCHVFKISKNRAPFYLQDHFTPVSTVHNHSTRLRSKITSVDGTLSDCLRYVLPTVKSFGKNSFAYNGCKLWNNLPQNVRDASTISSFKVKVKKQFLCEIDF